MLVSVILPVHNGGPWLERAIESIRSQTIDDWELIVTDDGSTDDTAAIANRAAAADQRVTVLQQEHRGVAAAAQAGMDAALSPYLARMDADDVCHPERLARQIEFLKANPEIDIVSCLVRFAGDAEAAGGYAHHVEWANTCITPDDIALNRFVDLPVPNPTLLFHKEAWERLGGFRVAGKTSAPFPEDYEAFLRGIEVGLRYGKVRETLYDWYDPPSRLTRNSDDYSPEAFWRCKAPFLAREIQAGDQAAGCERALWIWGAGRPTRQRANLLEKAIRPAAGFIDIDPEKIGRTIDGRPVIHPDDLDRLDHTVILACVASRGAREKIRAYLNHNSCQEGFHFWICA